MDSRRLVRWLAVTVLMVPCTLCLQDMINMLVLADLTVYGPKNVKFTEDFFTQFYSCLCSDRAVTCTAYLSLANQAVDRIDKRSGASSGEYSSFYNCTIPTSLKKMECNRQRQPTAPCDSGTLSTAFTLTGHTTNCSSGCVGFVWKSRFENLDTSHPSVDFDTCQDHCYGVITTAGSTTFTKPRTTSEESTTTKIRASSATNSVMFTTRKRTSSLPYDLSSPEMGTGASDDNIGIIIGVIFGIFAMIIITIIVFFVLWRGRRKSVESKAKTDTVMNNADVFSNNRTITDSTSHYVNDSNNVSKQCNVSVAEHIIPPGDNISSNGQYSAWPTDSSHDTHDRLSVLKRHAEETNIEDKNKFKGFAFEDIARYKDHGNTKALIVPNKHLRVSDEFGYSKVMETESENSPPRLEQTNIVVQDIMAGQEHKVMTASEKELGEKTVQVISSMDITRGEHNINGDYDLAAMTDDSNVNTEDVKHSSKAEDRVRDDTGSRVSANDSYGYYQIDNEISRVGQLSKPANVTNAEKETCRKLLATDYEYVQRVDQVEGAPLTEQGTRVKKASPTICEIDYVRPSIEDDDYSTVNETSPESRGIYSKLSEKRRKIRNPYNVLLQPKQDPKTRKLLPEPVHSPKSNSKQSNHSLAQLHLNKPTNPIEIVEVKPHSGININSSTHQDNIVKTPQGNLVPDTSKDETHFYFQLEKGEDVEDSDSDTEAVDYAVVKKKDRAIDKQDAEYELEKETDAPSTNTRILDYAVIKEKSIK